MTAGPRKISDRQYDPRLEAAHKRLRESNGQADALEAVREIVTNLLGCEEIALFTIDQQGNSALFWFFGIDPHQHKTLDAFDKSILHRVLQGEVHIAKVDGNPHGKYKEQPLRVFVPMRISERTVAVLVMLKLLPQKLGFDEADLNLVKLLSREAGQYLFAASAKANA
jgi:chemotaxis protein CheD